MHKKLAALLLFSLTALAGHISAQTGSHLVYEEAFTRTSTDGGAYDVLPSFFGWESYFGANATAPTVAGSSGGNNRVAVPNATGNPNTTNGFLTVSSSGAQRFALFDANLGLQNPLSVADITTISWKQGNRSIDASIRLMVQVNDIWYATNTDFKNSQEYLTAGDFANATGNDVSKSFAFTVSASDWREVTIIAGSTLLLDTETITNDLSGNITGIGFYVESTSGYQSVRLDTLEVYAVIPESASWAVLPAALALLAVMHLRRTGKARA